MPDWSPDGEWLVFSSNGTIQKCKIDGSELTTFTGLAQLEDAAFYFPDWSPDGSIILFDKHLGSDWGIYYTSVDFQEFGRKFASEIFGINAEQSATKPLVLFERGDGTGNEIFVLDTLNQQQLQLTINNRDNRSPTWSPDGQQIAWTSNVRIWIMNADGSNQREIARGKDPSWSVNDEIVYSNANSDYSKEVLFIIQPDGKNKRQITF
jgi:TolB protein